MWLSLIWFILVFFCLLKLILCNSKPQNQMCDWNQKKKSVLFCKNLKSSFSTWPTHLSLRFLYILGWSGPRCSAQAPPPAGTVCVSVRHDIEKFCSWELMHYLGSDANKHEVTPVFLKYPYNLKVIDWFLTLIGMGQGDLAPL